MGVARLRPVLTRRTTPERVNVERMRANAIEAAEQCGILRIPEVHAPEKLERVVASWDAARPLVFCDEGSEESCPLAALGTLRARSARVADRTRGRVRREPSASCSHPSHS